MTNEFRMCDLSEDELRELLTKQPDWLLDFLSARTLFDVRAIGMLLAMGRLAILYELECRQREQAEEQQFEQQRASHIDEVLRTVCNENVEVVEPQGMDNGLRAVIGRMYEASKEMCEERMFAENTVPVDTRPQGAVPMPGYPEVTDLGALDLPDEPF